MTPYTNAYDNRKYIVKGGPCTHEAVFLSDAKLWVSQQAAPTDYTIHEYIGTNPNLPSHYILVA
tara:strand:+ start:375 stop:566 length:192 start_codon:yes stop_codon:yes gene_type:complete